MTITIQSVKFKSVLKRSRHPEILQRKKTYIEERKWMFHYFFVKQYWPSRKSHENPSMKSRMPHKKLFIPEALVVGELIKKEFGYNEKTNVVDILFHFRRLYSKMYPAEILK